MHTDEIDEVRVLIVEDESLSSRLLERQICEIFPHAEIQWAETVDSALAFLEANRIDICMLDLFLGEQSGLDVLDWIGASAQPTAVVVLTAHSRQDLAAEALTRGAWDYLIKGNFDLFELEKSIRFAVYRKRREAEMMAMAMRDPLTGLANRSAFNDRLEHALQRATRQSESVALLYIDIDGFKPVNDTHGHSVGDALLKAIAERLQHSIRQTDTAARLGGDEFALVLENPADAGAAHKVAESIHDRLCQPYPIGETTIQIGASIGLAVLGVDGGDATALIDCADTRMYRAKRAGGGVVDCEDQASCAAMATRKAATKTSS